MKIDLHLHTTASDGILSPRSVVKYAKLTGHDIISITDHDTVNGIEEAISEGKKLNIRIIPGVEISAYKGKQEFHILGYFFDRQNKDLLLIFEKMKFFREKRIKRILKNLDYFFNLKVDFVEMKKNLRVKNYGRPHIALMLLRQGVVENVQQAFDLYLDDNGPCNVPKYPFSTNAAVNVIHKAGGVAILAHPGIYIANNIENLNYFLEIGIDGLEVFHPMHNKELTMKYIEFAREKDLIITGGSDYHGYLNEDFFSLNIALTEKEIYKLENMSKDLCSKEKI